MAEKALAIVIHNDSKKGAKWSKEKIECIQLHSTSESPEISIAHVSVNPGVTTALHQLDVQEVYRLVEGSGIIELDGEKHAVSPLDLVFIPKGVAQRITNTGKGVLRMDCTCTPRFTVDVYNHLADPIIDKAAAAEAAGVVATVPRFGLERTDAFKGQIAVVTGGNRGMGLELCRQLCMLGFTVVMTGRNHDAVQEAADKLREEGLGGEVVVQSLDVGEPLQIKALVDFCRDTYGKIDVLINNAGANFDATANPIDDPVHKLSRSMEVNTYGPMMLTQSLTSLLCQGSGSRGRVVNVSSEIASSEFGDLMFPTYQSAKSALNNMSRAMAPELLKEGIHLNVVDPGWVQTDMGGPNAIDSMSDGVQAALWLATTDKPPSGGFFRRTRDEGDDDDDEWRLTAGGIFQLKEGAEEKQGRGPAGMVQISKAAW
jgi:NAD(P)-dependent dehydrogenase (short-subunit alcohol dehydrogenase family)/mannose-6-phosphate isomerase-like protein (cupin superfamily)